MAVLPLQPNGYVCPRTVKTPSLDGRLDDSIWGHAPWTSPFVDIEGNAKPKPRFLTRAKMLWDDDALYIGAQMEEPHVWATLTEHDAIIYHDNDFEVFLDPSGRGHHYVELEVNPLNTSWDLLLTHPYRAGGIPISGWEFEGLRTAVHIDGTLNNPADLDTGWSIEIAIPWHSLRDVAGVACPPGGGDQWRINFSRVEWQHEVVDGAYRKVADTREDNWVWSPQYAIDMHRPEWWGVLQFTEQSNSLPSLAPLEHWHDQLRLVEVWEALQRVREEKGRYTADMQELDVNAPGLKLEATSNQFEAVIGSCSINQDLHMGRTAPRR